jgi:Ca-activated chloride channel homolog
VRKTGTYILLLFISILPVMLPAQPSVKPVKTRILFVMDASGSMLESWQGSNRMVIAKKVLSALMDSLQQMPNTEVGLRVFGSMSPLSANDCKDTKLEAPIRANNAAAIKAKLNSLTPKGITPIAYALEKAAIDFPQTLEKPRNIVILITDGIESCEGDPCNVSLRLQQKGIILKPFIVGLGLSEEAKQKFECMGKYSNSTNEKDLRNVLNNVVNTILNNTTTQINLLDENNQPTETDVHMTLYDAFSGLVRYNFVHTFNARGKPDTLAVDPVNVYNLVVHTTPPVELKNIELKTNTHNIISVPAPQGMLSLQIDGLSSYKDLQCRITKAGSGETVKIQPFGTSEKYLTGTYDLEIFTLPETVVKAVKVRQSQTTTVKIPAPGLLTMLNNNNVPVTGSIYTDNGTDLEWICNINGNLTTETITLQPGNYRIVYKARGSKKAMSTQERKFRIGTGSTEVIKLL